MIYYLFDNIFFFIGQKMFRWDLDLVGSVINWPLGSGSVNQDSGSVDLDPKGNRNTYNYTYVLIYNVLYLVKVF
jgi:hypothetical protein